MELHNSFLLMFFAMLFIFQFRLSACCDEYDWYKLKPKVCVENINYTLTLKGDDRMKKIYYKLLITDIFDISEERMEFGLQMMIFEFWKDPLLKAKHCGFDIISIPTEVSKCIWQPDLIFPNCKAAHLHKVTVDNVAFKLVPDDYIAKYARYVLKVICPMEFKYYPLDTQICPLNITLFSSFGNEVSINWIHNNTNDFISEIGEPVELLSSVKPMQFHMKQPVAGTDTIKLKTIELKFLICSFTFQRRITAALVNTYIPSFLVVCLSMVSFWIDVKAVPGRVTLGVTALLTLSTMIVHARSSLPPVNYMTAIDIWLFGCLLLVFLSLIEFTMAQAFSRSPIATSHLSTRRIRAWPIFNTSDSQIRHATPVVGGVDVVVKKRSSPSIGSEDTLPTNVKKSQPRFEVNKEKYVKDNVLDRWSRILFPSIMMFFISLYWYCFLKSALYE